MRVIGTTGHVDHGKSTLIAALTGTHPDRLREEQAREMTIELGFGWMTLPGGEEIGIVDVPGHRDFIENMLSGIGGIDAALLVIAADEGVMPQTREHLAILDLLQIPAGLIVLTKTDLTPDPAWLDLVETDIRAAVGDTVMRDAPIVRVSAKNRTGLNSLISNLESLLQKGPTRLDLNRPRLPGWLAWIEIRGLRLRTQPRTEQDRPAEQREACTGVVDGEHVERLPHRRQPEAAAGDEHEPYRRAEGPRHGSSGDRTHEEQRAGRRERHGQERVEREPRDHLPLPRGELEVAGHEEAHGPGGQEPDPEDEPQDPAQPETRRSPLRHALHLRSNPPRSSKGSHTFGRRFDRGPGAPADRGYTGTVPLPDPRPGPGPSIPSPDPSTGPRAKEGR